MITEFQGEYRWLSNFWPVNVIYDGVTYPSVENAYQAAKAGLASERVVFETCAPNIAKRLGKRVRIRPDWDLIRLATMYNLNYQKYQDEEMRKKLLATGDQVIQEGNRWHDTYWGVDLETGEGENHLGKILMQIREELK